jgi:hypothetical protein
VKELNRVLHRFGGSVHGLLRRKAPQVGFERLGAHGAVVADLDQRAEERFQIDDTGRARMVVRRSSAMTCTEAGFKKTSAKRRFAARGVSMPLPSCRTTYDDLLASWTGAFGGSDAAGAYRRYVTAGLLDPPDSPWKDAYHGWILGSGAFVERVKAMVRGQPSRERRRESMRKQLRELEAVLEGS